MKQEDKPIFDKLTDAQALAVTIYGEARGESLEGMLAVGSVILHRKELGYFGKGIKGVCFRPYQFSCYNSNDPNYPILLRIASNFLAECKRLVKLETCYAIANGLISGETQPNVAASFYKVHGCPASWEDDMVHVIRIGAHDFYREPGDKKAIA